MSTPKIYRDFYKKRVFTFQEIIDQYSRVNTIDSLRTMVRDCKKSGYIGAIRSSLYYIIPHGNTREDYIVDRYLIAGKLVESGIIAYHSALELHGVAESAFNRVYILASHSIAPFEFQGVKYITVKGMSTFGKTSIYRQGVAINVTDRERTLLDCLDRLKYSGGLEEFLKSIQAFPSVALGKIERYLKKMDKKSMYCKAGYVLSLFEANWTFPHKLRKKIGSNITKKIYYMSDIKKTGRLIKKWNLIAPKNINEIIKGA